MVRNILELLEILSILYAFAAIYRKKLEYNIQEVVFIVAEIVLMIGINDYGYPRYLASLSYILMIIYCILKYHSTVKEAIINVCITIISLGLLQLILGFALTTLFRNSNSNSLLWELLVMIVCFFCIYFGSGKIPFYKVTQFLMKRNKLLFLVGVFALIVFGRQIWFMQQRGYLLGKDYIPIIYFILLLIVLIAEWQKAVVRAEKEKAQMEMNTLYFSAYEEMIKSIRERQHDFKNHLNALRGMIQTIDDDNELRIQQKQYMDDVLSSIEDTSLLTLVENPPIAGFLSEKIHEAEKRNIIVHYQCILRNLKLNIAEYKLVEMMGIILDNAIEAAECNNEFKAIDIQLSERDRELHFEVTNTWNGREESQINIFFQDGYSSKGKNRGIGLEKLTHMLSEEKAVIFTSVNEKINGYAAVRFGFDIAV